jgi:GntR family transcriptional regulator, arabinose operon transcriptional repressor
VDDEKQPMYHRILEELRARILGGDLSPGDRIPTEKELMASYATSRITASRAVNELEALGYLVRLKAKGSFVTPRSHWRDGTRSSQASVPRASIAFVMPAPAGKISIEIEILHGAELECRDRGYTLEVRSVAGITTDDVERRRIEKGIIADALGDGSAGVIIYPCSSLDSPEVYNRMACRGFPFVLLDRKVFGVDAPLVSSDNKEGSRMAVAHLAGLGHERIAFVSGNTFESSSRGERFAGYVQGMNDAALKIFDEYIVHNLFPYAYRNAYYAELEERNQVLREAIKSMLDRFLALPSPPTAIATSNDYIALNVMNVAAAMGIDIPGTFSLSGFDGLSVRSYFTPSLMTVAQDFEGMGRAAVALLDGCIRNPGGKTEEIRLPVHLVDGESVRAPMHD